MGFLGATCLIVESYSHFKNSPVVTSVKTQPIDDLAFPIVTICPPLGSNTALNYDLMRADNNTLTPEMRQNLRKQATTIFDPFGPHEESIKYMLATANEENLEEIFGGFQAFPKPYNTTGVEVRFWNDKGTITTPWFGQTYNETYFKTDNEYHAVLEFPENLDEYIGDGSLVIELEVDIREGEEVFYTGQPKYKLYTSKKNWQQAERHCENESGHLASIHSEQENQEVAKFVGDGRKIWIGGSKPKERWKRSWRWTDGSTWGFTKLKKLKSKKYHQRWR